MLIGLFKGLGELFAYFDLELVVFNENVEHDLRLLSLHTT